MLRNAPKHEFRVQLGGSGVFVVKKIQGDFMARTCALTFQPALHRLSCSNETIQNAPKHYEMHQIMSLGSNGVEQVRSFRKNFDATSSQKLVH